MGGRTEEEDATTEDVGGAGGRGMEEVEGAGWEKESLAARDLEEAAGEGANEEEEEEGAGTEEEVMLGCRGGGAAEEEVVFALVPDGKTEEVEATAEDEEGPGGVLELVWFWLLFLE